jgi:rhodanese-related sulfurtransferase
MKIHFYHLLFTSVLVLLFTNCTENEQVTAENNTVSTTTHICAERAVCEKIIKEEDPIILDVRTPEEFQAGHLENAININFYDETFDQEVSKLAKNKPVVVYCAIGGRSAEATKKMATMGFTYIAEIKGGYEAWK